MKEYQKAINCWLLFKGRIEAFNIPDILEISNGNLHKLLTQEINWYRDFRINPAQFLRGEISIKTKWHFIYKHIAPELEKMFEALDFDVETEQLKLEV
jgi:hypothetical protein